MTTDDLKDSSLELHIGEGPLLTSDQQGRLCVLHGIHLPVNLQQRGVGTALIDSLVDVCRELGVKEVQASVGTGAGGAAMQAWGFRPAGQGDICLERRVLVIG